MRAAKATRRATVGTKEAAALLGCSEDRVRRMIRTGELRAEKVRGRFGMEYQIDKARLTNGAAKKREARGGTPPEPKEQVTAPPAPELPADAAPAPEAPAETPVALEPDPKEAAAEAEAARLREERDRWQQLWGQAQEELGRLSADAERARMLEARADGIAQAEARAQAEAERAKAIEARAEGLAEAEARARAEMEAAHRREREMARQERESRDLVEQARRRVEEVGRQMEEVLRRAAEVAEEEAAAKAAVEASRREREELRREVAQLRERARRWATVTAVAVAVALTAVAGLLVR